jgi:anion-transporting  ArsA/GET3 family ATPase
MWRPDDRRFVFVTGKGGVGKTTVTAALASALANRGKKVLVAMCNARERLSSMFASQPVGPDIVAIAPRIWAVNISPARAFEEYGRLLLKSPVLYRPVFRNRYVRSFLPAVPGLSEWAVLGKAWFHTLETDNRGGHRFDVVLLDAPSTGHGLDMLRVPKVILEVVPPGPLRKDAERAWAMFQDPRQTSVLVVTIPEELPTTETIQLVNCIRTELGLALGALVVNAVVPPLFDEAEREALAGLDFDAAVRPEPSGRREHAALQTAAFRAAEERLQSRSLARLVSETGLETIELQYLFEEIAAPAAIRKLARSF